MRLARPGWPISRERFGSVVWRVATLQSLVRPGAVVVALSLLFFALTTFTEAQAGGLLQK